MAAVRILIDNSIKAFCSDDRIKLITRGVISDLKYQCKKFREEQKYMINKYEKVKQKIKDQNRLLDKIRNNS